MSKVKVGHLRSVKISDTFMVPSVQNLNFTYIENGLGLFSVLLDNFSKITFGFWHFPDLEQTGFEQPDFKRSL